MKRAGIATAVLGVAAIVTIAATFPAGKVALPIFTDLAGKRHAPLSDSRPAVFLFLASDCPIASRAAPRITRLARDYEKRGVAFYAVYSNATETQTVVRDHARQRGLLNTLTVVRDSKGDLAHALGATVTPEAFLLDAKGNLRYHGRIDNAETVTTKTRHDLALALDALLSGKSDTVPSTRAVGCILRLAVAKKSGGNPPGPPIMGGGGRKPVALTPPIIGGPEGQNLGGTGDTVTYTRDVAPILDRRCIECHRAGEVGPMALDSYKQASSWAKAIRDYTSRREMPPWKADSHGEFLNERRLSDAEIATLFRWAITGAPEGDPADLPKTRPTFPKPGEWKMGEPDAVFTMPEPYTVPAEGKDLYRCFVIPTSYDSDKWVSSIEFLPGNRSIVHHINVFLDTSGEARRRDAADSGPGYLSPSPGNVPGFKSAGVLGGWIPGHTPWKLPEGVGNLLTKGADIVLEVHYITTGKAEEDRSRFGLRFVRGPVHKRLRLGEVTASGFRIPAGATNYTVDTSEFVREGDISLLSLTPHMHKLGMRMTATAQFPDGTYQPLITVNNWDFSWQMSYRFKEPVKLSRNTRIDLTAVYDNSARNPKNPHNPPQEVRNGESTDDEMCNLFVAYTLDAEDLTKTPTTSAKRRSGAARSQVGRR